MVLCCQYTLEIGKESGLFVFGIAPSPRGYEQVSVHMDRILGGAMHRQKQNK